MTKNRTFKRRVRERMASTGERYSTARGHVLADRAKAGTDEPEPGSMFASVRSVGGQQPDLAAARNLCLNAGVNGPNGEPMSEAMAFGLAGGIGFLYGVFEYADGPTMTIVARNRSMPDPFCEPLFGRVGATIEVATTSGRKKAATDLDRAIAAGKPAVCTVGSGALSYLGSGSAMSASAPHLVGVVGATDEGLLIDDRAPGPILVTRSEFAEARAAYRQGKHRMITVTGVEPIEDWTATVGDAVRAGAAGYDTPPVPQFASNVGIAGLEKFRRLLTDTSDSKGWPKLFESGRAAAIGLSRLFDCVEYAYTSPAAGRTLYADFLDEATQLDRRSGWVDAAGRLRTSGEGWQRIAALAAAAHPDLARYANLAEERAAQLDGDPDPATMAAAEQEQARLIESCEIGAGDATSAFAVIADELGAIIDDERQALAALGSS